DANKGLVIRRNSVTQAANLLEAQDETGAYRMRIAADGSLVAGAGGSLAPLTVYPINAALVAGIVKGLAAQTGDLFQWRSSADAVLVNVTGGGSFQVTDPGGVGNH